MSKITIWIPSMPQRSYSYRRGDCQVIHDDNHNCIIIDGGEDFLCDQAIAYCKAHGISHITYILSHWHYDHDRGMKLLLESSLIVDKIYCPPPADLTKLRDSDARDDYSRASQRIAQATNMHKSITYPPADKVTRIKVGTIVCDIWRRSVRPSENVDYQVNNTSLVCYFPDLYYMTSGDTINAVNSFLANKYGPIKVFKIPHHGNACTNEATSRLADLGAELCWYNHAEAFGTSIGGDEFSHWGALYCKNKGFICLRPFHEITMVAANKKLTVTQTKGYWYQFADGSWAVGWKKIEGKWYYFDTNGYRVHGWIKVSGYWYYLNPTDGVMLTGWLDYKNKRCYLDASGKALCNCTKTIDGKTYRFDAECYATETDGTETTQGQRARQRTISTISTVGTEMLPLTSLYRRTARYGSITPTSSDTIHGTAEAVGSPIGAVRSTASARTATPSALSSALIREVTDGFSTMRPLRRRGSSSGT